MDRPTPIVHHFDVEEHRITCGVRGAEHRSTKHARAVTCEDCVDLLDRSPRAGVPGRPEAAAHAHQPH